MSRPDWWAPRPGSERQPLGRRPFRHPLHNLRQDDGEGARPALETEGEARLARTKETT